MRSVLPRGSLRGLRALSTAGMRHTARQVKPNSERLANAEIGKAPTLGPAICCLYKGINAAQAQIAAALGFEATGTLKVKQGQSIPSGTIWQIETDDCDAPFAVEVVGDLVRVGRVMRLVAVKDVALNRP